jgi:hypothetical protein
MHHPIPGLTEELKPGLGVQLLMLQHMPAAKPQAVVPWRAPSSCCSSKEFLWCMCFVFFKKIKIITNNSQDTGSITAVWRRAYIVLTPSCFFAVLRIAAAQSPSA